MGRDGTGDGRVGSTVPGAMDLMGEIVALSMKHGMGMDVSEELKDILRRCDTEEDRQAVIRQCQALGIPV
jgi:FAD/FMN-containing dehydrogenase